MLPRSAVVEGTAAAHGKRVHGKLERGEPLPGVSPEQQAAWYPSGGEHEVQVWYDPITRNAGLAREKKNRDYSWAPPSYICGTVDFLHPGVDVEDNVVDRGGRGAPLVDDLKTGVLPPLTTFQLGLGALAASQEFKSDSVITSLTHVPRDTRLGLPARYTLELGRIDLDYIRETFDTMYARSLYDRERLTAGTVPVYKGPHCRYCAAKKGCPAWSI